MGTFRGLVCQGMFDLLAPLLVILDDGMYISLVCVGTSVGTFRGLVCQGMFDLLAPLLVILDDGMYTS